MSAGNLHPVEIYVVDDDVHHYHPLDYALIPLRRGVNVCDDVTLVLTGIPLPDLLEVRRTGVAAPVVGRRRWPT
jgi:hypothetical protein